MKYYLASRKSKFKFPMCKWRASAAGEKYICTTIDFKKAKVFDSRMDALLYLSAYADKYDIKGWKPITTKSLINNLKRERYLAFNYPDFKRQALESIPNDHH